jgi:diaminopimelate decarboxylase
MREASSNPSRPLKPGPDENPAPVLHEIVRRYGTPTYAYDLGRLKAHVGALRHSLPPVDILYSLKANASLGLCAALAALGVGADVASAGELIIATKAGFPAERTFVAGPYKSPEALSRLRSLPAAVLSIDSASELRTLGEADLPNACVLRLRPDFESSAVVRAGPESRFGIPFEDLRAVRASLSDGLEVIGFHVFSGSQVVDAAGVISHLRGAMDLSLRAAEALGIAPRLINLGGGFGVPYGAGEEDLDLASIGEELRSLAAGAAGVRLVLELGRYLVARAGWYLTTVVGHQTWRGRTAVVVDGGTHQRADLCGIGLRRSSVPPLVLGAAGASRLEAPTSPTDVLGCLSLPDDVLAESALLPPLPAGTVLAFPNAGAYGLWASPVLFHGLPLPAEVAFEGAEVQPMRPRPAADAILDGQALLDVTRRSR